MDARLSQCINASSERAKCSGFLLYVIFNDPKRTRAALSKAVLLAHGLQARLVLLAAQVVPYPLPLDKPPVSNEHIEATLSQLAADQEMHTFLKVYLCRDRDDTICHALPPDSLVVIGAKRRWWPDKEKSLARRLRREGHDVIVVPDTLLEIPVHTQIQSIVGT